MPCVIGVSGSSLTRPILLSPSPTSVSRCVCSRRCGLPVCSTLMVFPALAMTPLPSLLCDLLGVALAATGLQRGHLDVAARGNRARRILVLERVEGRAHHVV